jgi:hypothetical protein
MTSRPQDFFGSSPKTVLNKPFFHCQDVKAYNVDGGTSIADAWTKRTLNTVIYNDIQGATLSSDAVNLPAGTYRVTGEAIFKNVSSDSIITSIFKDGVKTPQQSLSEYATSGGSAMLITASGVITLTTPGTIDLRYFVGIARATDGLGSSNNSGSITDASISSIYADLKIWQLDRSLEIAPKAINSGLQAVAGLNTEGGVEGFDVTVSGNTLTITKGTCMSSDLTTPLAFTANKTCVLPATVNGDFYVFAVRLLDGVTFEARAYSTYAGPSSDAQIDKWRLVSFAKNNGSGVTMPFMQVGDRIDWLVGTNRPILTSSLTTGFLPYAVSAILPVTLLNSLEAVCTGNQVISVSYDGTTDIIGAYPVTTTIGTPIPIFPVSSVYLKSGSGSAAMHIYSATLRR